MKSQRRSSASHAVDGLAAVKAAAWAWYQHGSGREGRSITEVGHVRAPCKQRQSTLSPNTVSIQPQSSNSLLDVYEIERITRELDRLIVAGNERVKEDEGKRMARRRVSGFWMRQAMAGLCGRRDEVVEAVVGRRRRGRVAGW